MVDISLPAGTLTLFTDSITKFLFLESYEVSHQRYLKHFQAGKHFVKLGRFFEFDIHLECNHLTNETIPTSFLILHNISSQVFERVELLVEADAGFVKYQDFTTLISVGKTPLVVYLPRIPLKDIEVRGGNNIVTSYKNVTVAVQIQDGDIAKHEAKAKSLPFTPTYTEFLNSRWSKRWGSNWNIDYIVECKKTLREKLRYHLVIRNSWVVDYQKSSCFNRMFKYIKSVIGLAIFRILIHEWIIATIFWVPIFVRCRKLESSKEA